MEIRGVAASSGRSRGQVRIVRDTRGFASLRPGEVLVCAAASPAWTVLFATAGAVVTERGGVTTNPAIVARDLGTPAVFGVRDATVALRDGMVVTVDGDEGVVLVDPVCQGEVATVRNVA